MTNQDYFRNEAVQELVCDLVEKSGERGLTAVDILHFIYEYGYASRGEDEIIERLKRSEE